VTAGEQKQTRDLAGQDILISAKTNHGFRVYSPTARSQSYVVSGTVQAPICTCPDFQDQGNDPDWRCQHILAVLDRLPQGSVDPHDAEERAAIRDEDRFPEMASGVDQRTAISQMLIKRSVSPDGRIDSLSVEFDCPVEEQSLEETIVRARKILELQTEIVGQFMRRNIQTNSRQGAITMSDDGAAAARMLDVGGLDGKWGRRLFLRFDVRGRPLRLFGARKQLAEYVAAAGFPDVADDVAEGVRLNLPCRVMTKPSDDGRFVNIVKVLPAADNGS
jgi:predicted nucleic acid-binding Zn finger protein